MTDTPKIIGGFRVLKDLKAGAGSQGTVYQAVCEMPRFSTVAVGDMVALKVMAVQDDDGAAFARLEKRTAELAALAHPNVVKYHGCFREQGPFNDVHVIVLEFVEGRSLKELLESTPYGLGAEEALRIARGLVDALAYTSSRGIVHRDVKPGNVIVRADGAPVLIDFEVARREGGTVTTNGSNMIGTFDYMAPDFTDAEFRGDVTSDVFSMGVCLHEMLTGHTPYRTHSGTSSQANVVFLQRWLKAGTPSNPLHVSARVGKLLVGARELLERTLAPDRARRLGDFVSFGEALGRIRFRELAHDGRVWRLLSYVGHGGFGEVFAAVDRTTGERVAIKHLLQTSGLDRFRREARVMQKVASPCFTRFIDYFTAEDGSAFLVMDYLDGMPGSSLKDLIKANDGRLLEQKTVLTAFIRYAHGLGDLHALGIVHRDVKPSNLYFPISKPSRAVIMDLGIVRDVSGTATVGQVPGTIDYMPPECVTGKMRGGPEADVWALGLCLYEALSGRTAYPRLPGGVAAYEGYFKRVKEKIPPDFSGISGRSDLEELLRGMCAFNPEKRLRDMRLVERRLRALNGEETSSLPVPVAESVWEEAAEDADFLDGADDEAEAGTTLATVCLPEDNLPCLPEIAATNKLVPRVNWGRLVLFAVLTALVSVGGILLWREVETRRRNLLAEAERRVQQVAEEKKQREREDLERKAAEERRQAETERQRKNAERQKIERERLAREQNERAEQARKAEDERLAREKATEEAHRRERERLAREREDLQRAAAAVKKEEERLRAVKEEAAEKERERARRELMAAREKAEKEKNARQAAEAARQAKALAERQAREKANLERKVREEALARERNLKLTQLDASFEEYTRRYKERLDKAVKPGSRIDPIVIQQEWLIKKRAYKEARRKLESSHE